MDRKYPDKLSPLNIQNKALIPHWIAAGGVLFTIAAFLLIGLRFGHVFHEPLPEAQRLIIRSIFYGAAIITFPLTNLIRHIQLRLNQTMPGEKSAKARYFGTVIVSMSMVESMAVLGFVIFILGDDFNTLYIFQGLTALGVFLYRPKIEEYLAIVDALSLGENLPSG